MRAYCYASGLIQFGRSAPEGAIVIAKGPARPLREFIETTSRHGYRSEIVNGRLTKIPGTEHLLVPGVPETSDQFAKVDALRKWCNWIAEQAPDGVEVF